MMLHGILPGLGANGLLDLTDAQALEGHGLDAHGIRAEISEDA